MNRLLCIYHGNCADGFGAAWVVRKALGEDVEFHAGVYGDEPPDVEGRDVVIVDFSYKLPVLEEMAEAAESILVLDHHKTAAEDLANMSGPTNWITWIEEFPAKLGAVFDMERSGAGIAWDFFFPRDARPRLISHIEDRDLWRFKMPFTREVQANVFSYPYAFEVWDKLMAEPTADLISGGLAIERKHHKDVAELVAVMKRPMTIAGHTVPVASLPYTLTSDAGHLMAQEEPYAACYWDTPDGRVFSLRSTDDGLDVSEIAKKYGGGGHKHAAGFRMEIGWEGDPPS